MKRYLIILIIFPFFCFSQTNTIDKKGLKQGAWAKYYPDNKTPIYTGQFKDNMPIGEFRYFFPSGKVKAIIQHQAKNNLSYAWLYFENEQLMAEGRYKYMKKDSLWINYNSQGYVLSREEFKADKLNGLRVSYYLEGQGEDEEKMLTIENYKDSLLEGSYESFYSKGLVKEKGNYVKNKKEGEWQTFHPNGVMESRMTFKNNLAHGWAYGFDPKGKLYGKKMHRNGVLLEGEELDNYLKNCEKNGIDPNN
jgi:antitoxin component YwqK of YwqJK toxin-antitoxin module